MKRTAIVSPQGAPSLHSVGCHGMLPTTGQSQVEKPVIKRAHGIQAVARSAFRAQGKGERGREWNLKTLKTMQHFLVMSLGFAGLSFLSDPHGPSEGGRALQSCRQDSEVNAKV